MCARPEPVEGSGFDNFSPFGSLSQLIDQEIAGGKRYQDPEGDDDESGEAPGRTAGLGVRPLARLRHDRRWNQLDRQENPRRDDDEVVQVAENRHEIGNEVDRAEGVAGDRRRQCLRIPGSPWITTGEIERICIAFDRARSGL